MYFFEISAEIIYNLLFCRHLLLLKIDPVCTAMANPADDKCTNPMDDKSTNPNVSRQTINPELVRTRYVGSPIGHRPFLLHCITIRLSIFCFSLLTPQSEKGWIPKQILFSDVELFISQFSVSCVS